MGGSCGKSAASCEQPQASKACILSARSACRTTATAVAGPLGLVTTNCSKHKSVVCLRNCSSNPVIDSDGKNICEEAAF
eukprot:Skav211548  [mRNA]  locus=scaffold871:76932:77168:+ [translate_table: standard]